MRIASAPAIHSIANHSGENGVNAAPHSRSLLSMSRLLRFHQRLSATACKPVHCGSQSAAGRVAPDASSLRARSFALHHRQLRRRGRPLLHGSHSRRSSASGRHHGATAHLKTARHRIVVVHAAWTARATPAVEKAQNQGDQQDTGHHAQNNCVVSRVRPQRAAQQQRTRGAD